MAETIGVLGAGALGTLLAARLGRAGHTVHLLARSPARRETIRREALPVVLAESVESLHAATLAFLCVKSYDTAAAAASLAEADSTTAICSLQNGWGHMETLESTLPRSPLIAGATSLGAYFDADGALHASTTGTTLLAPWGESEFRWAEYAATLLAGAGCPAEARHDARGVLWHKLVLNAAVNPLSALCGRPNGALLESAPLFRIAEAAAREAARVGARLGALETGFDPSPSLRKLLEETRTNRSSMSEDLARMRRTEIEEIVGAVARAGRSAGEPVPVLEALQALVRAAEGRATRGTDGPK